MAADGNKIIVTDIDGTLIDRRMELPASAAAAVRSAKAAGHKVFVSTGRSMAEIPSHIMDLEPDGLMLGNGSYVEHDGRVLHVQHMPRLVAERAIAWLRDQNLAFYVESNAGIFATGDLMRRTAQMLAGKEGYPPSTEENEAWLEDVMAHHRHGEAIPLDQVNKISFLLEPHVDLEALGEQYEGEATITAWNMTGSGEDFGEFGQLGVDKGRALRALAKHLGRPLSDFVALGDAIPDFPLLELAGVGVAMGDAPNEVKQVVDLVTDTAENGGFAKALERLGLIEEGIASKETSSE